MRVCLPSDPLLLPQWSEIGSSTGQQWGTTGQMLTLTSWWTDLIIWSGQRVFGCPDQGKNILITHKYWNIAAVIFLAINKTWQRKCVASFTIMKIFFHNMISSAGALPIVAKVKKMWPKIHLLYATSKSSWSHCSQPNRLGKLLFWNVLPPNHK